MLIEVSNEKAKDIISTKHPKGLFFTLDTNGSYIAINNATGDASTKTFQTKEECFDYLVSKKNGQMYTKNNNDMVHHPNHYNYKSMECKDIIDIMCEGINEGQAYKLGCAIKYLYRYPQKGKPVQDLEKAKTYIDMIIKEIKKGRENKMNEISTIKEQEIKNKISNYIYEHNDVTFIEIEHIFDELGYCYKDNSTIWVKSESNIVIWDGWTPKAFNLVKELITDEKRKITVKSVDQLIYFIDGYALNLPIATSIDKKYKKPHWLPLVFIKEDV